MKNIINFIAFLLATFTLMTSCQENGNIGDLYGQWQITSIQKGSEIQHPNQVYLAFQNDCIFARIIETDYHFTYQIKGGFKHEGDNLNVSFFIDEEADGANIMHQYLSELFGFPLPHNDIHFEIRQLDAAKLILSNGTDIWQLRSY